MSRVENKTSRIIQIENLLLAHPDGMTQAEIARKLQVDRSTIHRDLLDLPKHIYEECDGRLKIDRTADLINVRLNLHEALAVHLAARLLATRMDRQNRHAAAAMRKLGLAMERWAARISRHVLQSADVMDDSARRDDPVYLQVLETLTLAWAEQRKAHIWHQSEAGERTNEYLLCPYFIEPYAVGQTTHVLGPSQMLREPAGWTPEKMLTFKIERIRRAEITREPYEIQADFDPRRRLADAWGIWTSDKEPVQVTLKFSRSVARRVQETQWHRSQQITLQPDDSLVWQAAIAAPQEMIPWVRGWGADCEVIAPAWLRKKLENEARRLAQVYGVNESYPNNDLIAHYRKQDGEEQPLEMHLIETSRLAERFASKVGLPEVGKILGLLHDLGKASDRYQGYLRSNLGFISPDEEGFVDARRGEVDHSTAGAQLVYQKLAGRSRDGNCLAQVLALVMASHHSGLIDCMTPDGKNNFQRRVGKSEEDTHLQEVVKKLPWIVQQLDEILAQPIEQGFLGKLIWMKDEGGSPPTWAFKHGLLARFLLSCLLDADRLDSADFEAPENEWMRHYGVYHPWSVLIERLEQKFAEFDRATAQMDKKSPAYQVNCLRAQVAQACRDFANKPKGIYRLTVPTGGGKTLASLRFALHHAQALTSGQEKIERIFYIVPYITIIDQNAGYVREILEPPDERDQVVLEHHSNLTPEQETRRHKLLAENWDAPVIFTTQVQFLEALFGAGTRNARLMHQLANSVIILDEVQTVPIKMTHLFTTALRFLVNDCGATVLLCTATQPPFEDTGNPYRDLNIQPEQHIIQNEQELFERLKRVEVCDDRKPGRGWSSREIADLAERALAEKGSVLAVMNTRSSARALYQEIKVRNLAETLHLSTNMCSVHRLDVLDRVRAKLKSHEPAICVSTQLIEAGVDIDFGAVIRALAGLDSIAQSAGRCNRHGLREGLGRVWVVNPADENLDRLIDIRFGREKAQTVLDDFKDAPDRFGNDLIGLDSIMTYYNYYYGQRQNEMNYPVGVDSPIGREDDLFNLLSRNTLSVQTFERNNRKQPEITFRQSFQSAGKAFHVIDSLTQGVVVPYGKGEEVITNLCGAYQLEKQSKLLKMAQRYSVSLFSHEFINLANKGAIHEVQVGAGIYYLEKQYYSEHLGWCDQIVNDMDLLCI